MKTILCACIACVLIASPAHSELTPQDLDKIRLILTEEISKSETRLKKEISDTEAQLKKEISDTEAQLKLYIDLKIQNVETQIKGLDTKMDTKIDNVEKRVTFATNLVYALIALIVVAVGIPQMIIVWRGREERALERRMEEMVRQNAEMAQAIETLKQQQSVKP